MSFFCDANLDVNKNKEVEKALKYYIDYVKRHNGKISPRFENGLKIKFLQGSSTLAEANSNVEENCISLRENPSIVTFFHELRHISDQWQDPQDGKYYSCWEYEKDYGAQMCSVPGDGHTIIIKRGIHGRFLSEATAELYASKVFWEMSNYSRDAINHTSKRTFCDYEVTTLKQICVVLDINEDEFLNWKSENDFGRDLLRKRCKQLTGQNGVWDYLENCLDFIEMKNIISVTLPGFRISPSSLADIEKNKENVKNIFNYILKSSLDRGFISADERTNKLKELKSLSQYNRDSSWSLGE